MSSAGAPQGQAAYEGRGLAGQQARSEVQSASVVTVVFQQQAAARLELCHAADMLDGQAIASAS